MRRIDRRSAVALGLGSVAAAAASRDVRAQAQQPPQQKFAERVVEARLVFTFPAEPDAVRRFIPEGWDPFALPTGSHRGNTLVLTFWERLWQQGSDGRPTTPAVWRYATLVANARARDDGRTGFVHVAAWLPAASAQVHPFGEVRVSEVRREATVAGGDDGPARVRETWTVRAAEGGDSIRLHLDYRRDGAATREPFTLRLLSAPAVRPPVEHLYRGERVRDVLRSEGTDDPRLARLELDAAVPELREILGGRETRPRAFLAEPGVLRDLPAS
jgi:hypothetical protein